MSIKDEVEAFLREKLAERLGRLTTKQRAFFPNVYPGVVSRDKLEPAIDLCDRTLMKNEKLGRHD